MSKNKVEFQNKQKEMDEEYENNEKPINKKFG